MRLAANFVFLSSRRRHTRLQGDWSSDVCSSDLARSGESIVRGRPVSARGTRDGLQSTKCRDTREDLLARQDRKSTRLNSSHLVISYAVFCLKKKTNSRSITT